MPNPTATDLRSISNQLMERFAEIPDDRWDINAHQLDWTCRETVAHLMDDFGFYAMQLSGEHPPAEDYIDFMDPPPWTPDGPQIVFWPDPDRGTVAIVRCLDATAGLLCGAITLAGDKRGFHPFGTADASGFAAMGLTEAILHGYDILLAQDVQWTADATVCDAVLSCIFPAAERTDDPWHDLLTATGRTPETRGRPWRWDSSVRSQGD